MFAEGGAHGIVLVEVDAAVELRNVIASGLISIRGALLARFTAEGLRWQLQVLRICTSCKAFFADTRHFIVDVNIASMLGARAQASALLKVKRMQQAISIQAHVVGDVASRSANHTGNMRVA